MDKLKFSVDINASASKVWEALWGDANYRKWTNAFAEGSHVKGDLKEGNEVKFLDGKGNGMYSVVVKSIPGELMSIRHLGVVKDGEEQPADKETEKWGEALENYTLTPNGGITTVTVEMDMVEEFKDYFNNTFPKALAEVKKIAEA